MVTCEPLGISDPDGLEGVTVATSLLANGLPSQQTTFPPGTNLQCIASVTDDNALSATTESPLVTVTNAAPTVAAAVITRVMTAAATVGAAFVTVTSGDSVVALSALSSVTDAMHWRLVPGGKVVC